jgi:L-asparagine transporter-like permease
MKSLLLVGGALGWGVGMGASYMQGHAGPTCLWHGCLGAYLTALLMRWWGRAWRKSLEQSFKEREKAQPVITSPIITTKVSRP